MCLRSVHSLHSFVRHPFRYISLLFISLHYFLTTSFRSFHPPQHRTQEKLFLSFKECNHTVSFRHSVDASNRTVNAHRNLHQHEQLHFTHRNSFLSFSRFPCLCLRTIESSMLYFFLRLVYPILRTNTEKQICLLIF